MHRVCHNTLNAVPRGIKTVKRNSAEFHALRLRGWLIHKETKTKVQLISPSEANRIATYNLNKALGWF